MVDGVAHAEPVERAVADALARLLGRLACRVEPVPFGLPVIDHGRPVGLGQPVEMGDVEARLAHGGEHRLRRRRGRREERDLAGSAFFSSAGALRSVDMTIGAPHRCVTPSRAISSKIGFARTCRRQTCVPATTEIDQGKHQPLQWNIGKVHR